MTDSDMDHFSSMEQQTEHTNDMPQGVDDEWENSLGETDSVPKSQRICRLMCITNNTGFMILLWTMTTMLLSGNSFNWFISTSPYFQRHDQQVTILYPLSAVTALVLTLYPVFSVLGDYFPGKLWPIVTVSFSLTIIGTAVTFTLIATIGNPYLTQILGFGMILSASGVFQANIIQYAMDTMQGQTSPKRSTFLHWYYWATYTPCVLISVWFGAYQFGIPSAYKLADFLAIPVLGLLILLGLLVTCIVRQCSEGSRNVTSRHVHENPVKQIGQVTWVALRRKSHPALSRLDLAKRSNGGPLSDERVDDVKHFWRVFLVFISMFGFFFWDNTRSTVFIHSVIYNDPSVFSEPSSQVTTVIVIFLGIPIYQIFIRPFLGNRLPSVVVRIMLGLLLQLLTSLLLVGVNGWMAGDLRSNPTSNISLCYLETNSTTVHHHASETISFSLLYIPQAMNGLSQMLVFIGALELVLTQAPRTMQGLLIGLWYAMQSIHTMVGIVELASCAVYYWEYYILKTVIVLASIVTYSIAVFLCSHKRNTSKYQLLTDTTEI